jgi:Lrp/AsnC family leucine-responsive transcriptional regulator
MDTSDRKIIDLLAEDARRSLASIGDVVGLSPSAVNERIRRLVASGAIRRFTLEVDPAAIGLPITAFMLVTPQDTEQASFRDYAESHPAVLECHHVTGSWSYMVKIRTADLTGIEAFLADLKGERLIARSETMIALSTTSERSYVIGSE